MGLKVIIVEDEPSIARHLERILINLGEDVIILNIFGTVEETVSWLENHMEECDLIFSDIQLSDGLSFEIFKQILPTKPIIFITAYEEYTMDAFQTNGIHYVVKPFEKHDIVKAVEKYKLLTSTGPTFISEERLASMIARLSSGPSSNYKKAYLVHFKNKLIPVNVTDIAWFYTENEIVYAQTYNNKTYTIESTLERIFSEISPIDFYRANRQFIVGRDCIRDIDFYFHGRLIMNVVPSPDKKIVVSKAKVQDLKKWIGSDIPMKK